MSQKILIVEHETSLRESLIELFYLEGFEAIGTENSTVGLEIVQSQKPDFIICNMSLPDSDSLIMLEKVRQHPDPLLGTIPFVYVGNWMETTLIHKAKTLGIDDYFRAPIHVKDLIHRVHEILDQNL